MNIRYQLLPYMYTLFYLAHNTGSTVMRALAWEFPNDPSLAAADRQFFLGPAILVTPVLGQGYTNVSGVFPGVGKGEVYYDWYNLSAVTVSPGENVTIDAPLGHIPVYIRGNNVIPTQEPALVTRDARKNPWGVVAALSPEGTANGKLYIDDGESLVQNATLLVEVGCPVFPLQRQRDVLLIIGAQFTASNSALYASVRGLYKDGNALANITVLGVQQSVSKVSLGGNVLPSNNINYDMTSKALVVTGLNNATSAGAWSSDWVLRWE